MSNKELVEKFRQYAESHDVLDFFDSTEQFNNATACATIAEEYARGKDERIKKLEDVLRELLKWCEPDGRWNFIATIEKANYILNN